MLLATPRFFYFFLCQFCGVISDSLFRLTLVAMLSFGVLATESSGFYIQFAAALFMLPFFLFSPLAGVVADTFSQRRLLRIIKVTEFCIITLAVIGINAQSLPLLLLCLFLTGAQSAFFGPIKYALLPALLKKEELITGNAWFSATTFAAILLGTIVGTVAGKDAAYAVPISVALLSVSAIGIITAFLVPPPTNENTTGDTTTESKRQEKIRPWQAYSEVLQITHRNPPIFRRVLAASCFWLAGGIVLNELPHLGYEAYTQMLLMVLLGVCLGAGICRYLLAGNITVRYSAVTIGSAGILLIIIAALYDPKNTTAVFAALIVAFCAVMTIFVVPLRTSMQALAAPAQRARVISCYNVYNSGFIVAATLLSAVAHLMFPANATIGILAVCGVFLTALALPVHRLLCRQGNAE